MCDITQERERIDAILEQALSGTAMFDHRDEDALVEIGLMTLREYYADICSDECMRARCEAFVARLRRQRWASDGMTPESMSACAV